MPSLRVGFVVISVVDGCCYETAWYAVYACWFCWCLCGMVAVMRRHGMPSMRVGFVVISVVDGCCYETAWLPSMQVAEEWRFICYAWNF